MAGDLIYGYNSRPSICFPHSVLSKIPAGINT